MTRKVWKLQH